MTVLFVSLKTPEIIEKQRKIAGISLENTKPRLRTDYLFDDKNTVIDNYLQRLKDEKNFAVLLSHRSELFEIYVQNKIDLITGLK